MTPKNPDRAPVEIRAGQTAPVTETVDLRNGNIHLQIPIRPLTSNRTRRDPVTELEALAGGRALGEWAREVLLRELEGRQARPAEETLLAKVLALRTILLNAFYRLAEREKLMAEGLQSFIDRADAGKVPKAIERLAGKPGS